MVASSPGASSRDKILETDWGIPNGWHARQRLQLGPWYGEGDGNGGPALLPHPRAVRHRVRRPGVASSGAVLLGWGNDFICAANRHAREAWTNEYAKRHAHASHVMDPYRLRVNAYRVLLTRGRDGAVIFVPPDPLFDATAAWLQEHGVKVLD